jgi:deoxyribonuclease (pyrimidine dimer)
MTRINIVPVSELSDQHLLTELRELPRICTHVKKHGINEDKIPETFCLGKGHVLFFTNKLKHLQIRYNQLVNEWESRGFNWSFSCSYFYNENVDLFTDFNQIYWEPNEYEIRISSQRIEEKIKAKPSFYKWSNNK